MPGANGGDTNNTPAAQQSVGQAKMLQESAENLRNIINQIFRFCRLGGQKLEDYQEYYKDTPLGGLHLPLNSPLHCDRSEVKQTLRVLKIQVVYTTNLLEECEDSDIKKEVQDTVELAKYLGHFILTWLNTQEENKMVSEHFTEISKKILDLEIPISLH